MRRFFAVIALFLLCLLSLGQEPPLAAELRLVTTQGRGTPEGRAAWDRIVATGPKMVPHLLLAMNKSDVVAGNWLRTALDRIVEEAPAATNYDADALLAFAKSGANVGRARRLALELVDKLKPGTSQAWFAQPATREDAEFRHEAVAEALLQAKALGKKGDAMAAKTLFRGALESARDVQQARDAVAGLGENISVGRHLGFLLDWHLIGPFDGKGQKGFHLEYPPEKKVDLTEELDGQGKKVRWKLYRVREAAPTSGAKHQALVNLRERDALGDADDAVAFAYTEFSLDKARVAEFRGAADDNFTVYVNGVKAFAFEEYRNGVRLDRHRFKVNLREGKNTVLVKIVQSAAPNPEPNWEFFLRVVDDTGRGIAMTSLVLKNEAKK